MKRVLKILLFIIILIALVALIAWMRARNTAVKKGQNAPSFREFISGQRNISTTPPTQGDGLSSEFTDTPQTPSETTPTSSMVTVSRFTSAPLSPTDQGNQRDPRERDPRTSSGGSSGTSGGGQTGGGGSTGGGGTTPPAPACSDEDLNIVFTAEEIARLNTLQQQFYDLAGTLHTDEDIATELANYDNFKAKGDQALDLYTYCSATAPRITAPAYTTRVSTPFWRDSTKDRIGYIPIAARPTTLSVLFSSDGTINPVDVPKTQVIIQRIFALDLW